MGTLALVRHGQASFFADNYDQLSSLGEQQARLLGEYWLRRGVRFDRVYTGPRVRQIETAALVGEAYARAGLEWPEPQIINELDEHHVDRMMKQAMRQILEKFPRIAELFAAYQATDDPREKHRTFQLMFEPIVEHWVAGEIVAEGVENWQEFKQRVLNGFQQITLDQPRGQRVAAFSSVGVLTICLQRVLALTDQKALGLGWRIRNASVTEFVFNAQHATLDGFNAVPHLEDGQMWTYR